ncbi:lipolytic protein G-D-S-L family [Pleurocapsa sp. CCALA 161]|uniref:SGNH/GDSL hydrolase family protein n=1 Tax=Pleurocapsa sp. CCALA 161 TaxID=2107688 RepID=UPI000D05C358|nr:SGNH/GDSL hydrolase family protein [Pleurocapsa sp. CCALA 161]PSB07802.1 lipolytic protein G-D-S-L family [Pleurocapsa sp. CCALA 161]
MFKSKVKHRPMFTPRRRARRRFSVLGAIVTVGLFLLSLELLTRIFFDLAGDQTEFAQINQLKPIDAYKLDFQSANLNQQTKTSDFLLAKSNMSLGYSLVENQQHKFWQINAQGFRDRDPVPLVKPKGEIRIFLLGNSTAFGYGSSSNAKTISDLLEARLQQRLEQQQLTPQIYQTDLPLPPGDTKQPKNLAKPPKIKTGKYRIINAAVPGYASGNELAQIALQVLKYQPDLIILLDGYQDLMLPSDRKATQIPASKVAQAEQPKSIGTYIDQLIEPVLKESYLARVTAKYWNKSQPQDVQADFLLDEQTANLVKHLPQNEPELKKRIARYTENQKQILNLSTAAQVPLLVAIQPEITGRDPSKLTSAEGKIITELGRTYIEKLRKDYPAFTKAAFKLAKSYPNNVKVVNLYHLTDKYPSPSFLDPIHLNELANEKAAEQLYYGIASMPKMQEKPRLAKQLQPLSGKDSK